MLSSHPDDIRMILDGTPYVFRLTLCGLARVSNMLDAPGPSALATQFVRLDHKSLHQVVDILGVSNSDITASTKLSDDALRRSFSAVAELFETALCGDPDRHIPPHETCDGKVSGNPSQDDNPWPFTAWLKIAVKGFGLSPQCFWNTALGDWLRLLEAADRGAFTRADFAALKHQYPDGGSHE